MLKDISYIAANRLGVANTENRILLTGKVHMYCGFGNRQENHMELRIGDMKKGNVPKPVYIPPKEIISSTENSPFIDLIT